MAIISCSECVQQKANCNFCKKRRDRIASNNKISLGQLFYGKKVQILNGRKIRRVMFCLLLLRLKNIKIRYVVFQKMTNLTLSREYFARGSILGGAALG